MPLLMPLNLLCPFQTGPGAVQLRANPEAGCHVGFLLSEAVEGGVAEEPFALHRFATLSMHPLAVIF